MAKPLFQDIIPPERRSIKHIPVPRHNDDRSVPIRHEQEPVRRMPEPPRREPEPIQPTPIPVQPAPVQQEYEPNVIRPRPQPVSQPRPTQSYPRPELQPIQRPATRYEAPQYGDDHPNPRFDLHRPQSPIRERRSIVPRIVITLLIIGIILAGAVWSMSRVTASTVTIVPKQETVNVDSQFTANKQSSDGLQFQIVTYAKDGKLAVASTGQEQAQTKASGIIIIYNSGGSEQTLIANTRFQTDKGLIFRISQPVTIPAATTVSGKKVPGSVEAAVTADAIGPEYNVGLVDFKVPGLKGDPRYDLIEARSKPQNPIQGGFNGTRNKVEEKELAAAREKVRDELKTNLIKELEKYIPKDYVMPTNAYVILYESLPDIQENNGVKINERATFHGYIFKKAELARELALKVKGANSLPSEVTDVNKLVFAIQVPAKEPWNSQTIGFSLKGSTSLVATVDTDKLRQELLGKPRTSLNAILASYPAVARAQVTMRPFWKKSFPTVKEEITITIANPLTP